MLPKTLLLLVLVLVLVLAEKTDDDDDGCRLWKLPLGWRQFCHCYDDCSCSSGEVAVARYILAGPSFSPQHEWVKRAQRDRL